MGVIITENNKDDKVDSHGWIVVKQRLLVERRAPHGLEHDGRPVLKRSNLQKGDMAISNT